MTKILDLMLTGAHGAGLANCTADGTVLDVWYPAPALGQAGTTTQPYLGAAQRRDAIRDMDLVAVDTAIKSLADPPVDTADVYLRLHLLSARLALPRSINLDGIFALLPNNAWTSLGPVAPESVEEVRLAAAIAGQRLHIYGVDKFPRMTDYVVPSGV